MTAHKRKKSLVVNGYALLRKNFITNHWDLVKMLNPDGGWALFHSENCANEALYISQSLTGKAVEDKISKIRITIEEI